MGIRQLLVSEHPNLHRCVYICIYNTNSFFQKIFLNMIMTSHFYLYFPAIVSPFLGIVFHCPRACVQGLLSVWPSHLSCSSSFITSFHQSAPHLLRTLSYWNWLLQIPISICNWEWSKRESKLMKECIIQWWEFNIPFLSGRLVQKKFLRTFLTEVKQFIGDEGSRDLPQTPKIYIK